MDFNDLELKSIRNTYQEIADEIDFSEQPSSYKDTVYGIIYSCENEIERRND